MIQPTISWLHQVLDHRGRDRMIDTIMARYHHPHLRAAISQFTCQVYQQHKSQGIGYGYLPQLLAYYLTINTSQGQILDVTGIELPTNVFMHRHLYVGCGRTGNPDGLHIYANQDGFDNIRDAHLNPDVSYVPNVVWPELLIPH